MKLQFSSVFGERIRADALMKTITRRVNFVLKGFKDVTLSRKQKSFNNVFFDLLGISRVYIISVVILIGHLHTVVIACFYFSPFAWLPPPLDAFHNVQSHQRLRWYA